MSNRIVGFAAAAALAVSGSAWSDTQDEVNKQVAKLIGDAVSSRVSSTVAGEAGAALPNNAWGSYSRLYVDPKGMSSIGTDITVLGYDRDLGKDWTVGVALSYNSTSEFHSHGWNLSPYLAYRFSKSYFAVARADFSDFGAPGITGHGNGLAVSFNGAHDFGNLYGKWRVETGVSEFDARSGGVTTTSSSTKYLADGELGYRFGSGFSGFAGVQVSDTNRQDSYATYLRLGVEKEIAKDAAISAKYESKVDDNIPSDSRYSVDVFTIAARFRF